MPREPRENHELAAWLEYLSEASMRATGKLEDRQWLPSRAHYEGLRNTINEAIRFLTALRRPSPVAESGEYVVDPQPEIAGAPISKIVSYNQAHEDAVEMGYPSLTEALEHLSELRSPVAESTPTDATAVEAERDGDKCACFCPTDECQRVCTLDCLNAGARIPPRQADMADAQKAESTPSPDTEGVSEEVLEAWAFNVMLECSHPDAGEKIECAIGGAVLDLRDLNRLLTWFRTAQNTGRDEVLGDYSPAEIEFIQCLLDRYSEGGGVIPLADDHEAFMRIVRRHYSLKSSPPVSTVDEEGGGA